MFWWFVYNTEVFPATLFGWDDNKRMMSQCATDSLKDTMVFEFKVFASRPVVLQRLQGPICPTIYK